MSSHPLTSEDSKISNQFSFSDEFRSSAVEGTTVLFRDEKHMLEREVVKRNLLTPSQEHQLAALSTVTVEEVIGSATAKVYEQYSDVGDCFNMKRDDITNSDNLSTLRPVALKKTRTHCNIPFAQRLPKSENPNEVLVTPLRLIRNSPRSTNNSTQGSASGYPSLTDGPSGVTKVIASDIDECSDQDGNRRLRRSRAEIDMHKIDPVHLVRSNDYIAQRDSSYPLRPYESEPNMGAGFYYPNRNSEEQLPRVRSDDTEMKKSKLSWLINKNTLITAVLCIVLTINVMIIVPDANLFQNKEDDDIQKRPDILNNEFWNRDPFSAEDKTANNTTDLDRLDYLNDRLNDQSTNSRDSNDLPNLDQPRILSATGSDDRTGSKSLGVDHEIVDVDVFMKRQEAKINDALSTIYHLKTKMSKLMSVSPQEAILRQGKYARQTFAELKNQFDLTTRAITELKKDQNTFKTNIDDNLRTLSNKFQSALDIIEEKLFDRMTLCEKRGDVKFGGVCMTKMMDEKVEQDEAERICVEKFGRDANLLVLNDKRKENVLRSDLLSTELEETQFWMCVRKSEARDKRWTYPTGTLVGWEDYFPFSGRENCVKVSTSSIAAGYWQTTACNVPGYFICEYPYHKMDN
jgi:hypothetical protein